MISAIKLHKTASYKDEQTLSNISEINFIYGENGCGKSTIATLLDCTINEKDSKATFDSCSVSCLSPDHTPLKAYVYDSNFLKNTISQSTLDGVFVLGRNAPDLERELFRINNDIDTCNERVNIKRENIKILKEEAKSIEDDFTETCWKTGKKYSQHFEAAYAGYKHSRAKFKEKCISSINNDTLSHSLDELIQLAKLYYSPSGKPESLPIPPRFTWTDKTALSGSPLLEKRIKGKEQTSVAELIARLNNNDWVDQGRAFFDGKTCPFCQQITPSDFISHLESYFDSTYQNAKIELKKFTSLYEEHASRALSEIHRYQEFNNEIFNFSQLRQLATAIESTIKNNILTLHKKNNEPSEPVTLEALAPLLEEISITIEKLRSQTSDHNEKILNFKKGKADLTDAIWAFLGTQLSMHYDNFKREFDGKQRGITNLDKNIDDALKENDARKKKCAEIRELLRNATKPADDINNILSKFGFTNFSIKLIDDDAHYAIVREDGSKANTTLSEGEKTFIAFLYFYQTLKGTQKEEQDTSDKIVIIDDPVSSLDSKILYVVSTLIKELCKERAKHKIHQLFILTHNIYFFKEVTNQRDSEGSKSSYWTIRKINGCSKIEQHSKNPIRTSYQMLWDDVIRAKHDPSLDVRNTLRRIIENYFEFFGNIKKWTLAENFEGPDKEICNSLLQWTNDGSHSVFDDIYMTHNQETRDSYLRVFEEIFIRNNHQAHYDMMMQGGPDTTRHP